MQAATSDSSATQHPEFADGRHSLRLVKLRLVLTLLAVAILPLAAIAPMIRTILDDPRIAQHERLVAQSEHVTAEIRRELAGIQTTMTAVAADASLPVALAAKPASDRTKSAAAHLTALTARPSGVVVAAALVDPTGLVHASAGKAGAVVPDEPPPQGEVRYRTVPASGSDAATLEIVAPVVGPKGSTSPGVVIAAVPLAGLLTWANEGLATAGTRLAIEAVGGDPLAAVATNNEPASGEPPTLELTANTANMAIGAADIPIAGTDGWRVVSSAPLTVVSIPLPAMATLAALLLLLVGATVWMGRKIVEPAAELEAQRVRFQDLYHTAREAALLDNLTGLGNHRSFQEALARSVEQTRRYGSTFALILLDVDEFKRVNDTRGHAVGDELLAEVGELIRATIRATDAGFRIGGDEFAILLAGTSTDGAAITAKRILSRGLEARGAGRFKGAISFSAGITACPDFGTTRLELTAQADAALYRGKRGGRTLVSIFDPGQDRGHVDEGMRSELSASVAAVIEAGALSAVYQPIVHLATGRIIAYEGLVRIDPKSGFANTGTLFDAAEVAGRVLDLDRAALDVVLRGAHAIPGDALISLNVSPRSFEAAEFNATVFLAILRRHGMDPGRVLLELTERDAIRDPERLRETVQALQQAGIRVAADDVGAGNAGLRLLSQFRFDVVKIDLSLVQGGADQDQTLSVLTSLVGLARRWGALTIAEGVETAAQLRVIRQLDIDAGQGYLLGRPGPITSATSIDLDELAGGPAGAAIEPTPAPTRRQASFEVAAAPVLVAALAPTPVPTAASVIAGNGPSLFSQR